MRRSDRPAFRAGLYRFALFLVGATIFLITAGGLVKSREAGLSVPDWPLSYGMVNPPNWWNMANVRAEHGHRLIAGTVALLSLMLAVWVTRRESRAWLRQVAILALVAVFFQAVLGGLTVLLLLPPAVSVAHAALAQLFLCLLVVVAVATSRAWLEFGGDTDASGVLRIRMLATTTTIAIYAQILLGAVVRHSGAGLAIPDFPLAFGRLVPSVWDFPIGVHFAHRLGALLVATLIFWTLGRVLRLGRDLRLIFFPAVILAVLVLGQGTLGAWIVLTERAVVPNTLHVGGGALLLVTSLVLTLFSWHFAAVVEGPEPRSEQSALGGAARERAAL